MTPEIARLADEMPEWTPENFERAWCAILPHVEKMRRTSARREDSEAALERRVLRRIGELQREQPTILAWRNEVGLGYQGSILSALQAALAPFGREVIAVALATIRKHRVAFGAPGSPDLWVVVDGRAAGIELKTDVGRLSEVQRDWHDAARRRGAFVTVVRHPDEVGPALERARRGEVR